MKALSWRRPARSLPRLPRPPRLRQLGLRARLLLGMGSLMLLFGATTVLALWHLQLASDQLQRIVERDARRADLAHELRAALLEIGMQERSLLPMTDEEDLKSQFTVIQRAKASYVRTEARLSALPADDPQQEAPSASLASQLAAIRAVRAEIEPVHARAIDLVMRGAGAEPAFALLLQTERAELQWRERIAAIVAQTSRSNEASYLQARQRARQARLILLSLLALATAASLPLALGLARNITRPVAEATHVAESIAGGDFGSTVRVQRTDELGRLLGAIGAMQDKLRQIVSGLAASATSIEGASGEIATGSQQLSERTEQTASGLRQTTAATRELAAMVTRSADAAQLAKTQTENVRRQAQDGGRAMAQVTAGMAGISAATAQNASLQQIGAVLSQLDAMTQQNAAMGTASVGTATMLGAEAGRLVDLVRLFQTPHPSIQSI